MGHCSAIWLLLILPGSSPNHDVLQIDCGRGFVTHTAAVAGNLVNNEGHISTPNRRKMRNIIHKIFDFTEFEEGRRPDLLGSRDCELAGCLPLVPYRRPCTITEGATDGDTLQLTQKKQLGPKETLNYSTLGEN